MMLIITMGHLLAVQRRRPICSNMRHQTLSRRMPGVVIVVVVMLVVVIIVVAVLVVLLVVVAVVHSVILTCFCLKLYQDYKVICLVCTVQCHCRYCYLLFFDNCMSQVVGARDKIAGKKTPLLVKIAPDLSMQQKADIASVVSKKGAS